MVRSTSLMPKLCVCGSLVMLIPPPLHMLLTTCCTFAANLLSIFHVAYYQLHFCCNNATLLSIPHQACYQLHFCCEAAVHSTFSLPHAALWLLLMVPLDK